MINVDCCEISKLLLSLKATVHTIAHVMNTRAITAGDLLNTPRFLSYLLLQINIFFAMFQNKSCTF